MEVGGVVAERFVLERVSGSGGMGRVFRALDRLTGAPVAVKVLTETRGRGAERFAREARVLADLRHPGIVRYVAHGVAPDGSPFLAMEWLEGEDLGALLRDRRLEAADAMLLARRVAEALGVAHAAGVVHRDIKPSNLFLPGGDVDRVKVLDFGIARLSHGAVALTRTGLPIGTPGYMAPPLDRPSGSFYGT